MSNQEASQQTDLEMEDIPELPPDTHNPGEYKHALFWLDVAHKGIMVDHVAKAKRWMWGATKFAATGDTDDLVDPAEGDDMGVLVGNQVHVHVAKKQAEQMGMVEPESPSEQGGGQSSGQSGNGGGWLDWMKSKFLPLLLAGSLGAGGVGVYQYCFPKKFVVEHFDGQGNLIDIPRLPIELRQPE